MRLLRALVRSVSIAASSVAVLLCWAPPALPHAGNSNPSDIHACISRITGVVRIVGVTGHCVSHHRFLAETAVHWPGVASTPSTPAPTTAPLRFVDANLTVIGPAIAPDRVVIDLGNGTLITVGLDRSGFQQTPPEALLYENQGCPPGEGLLGADTASNFTSVSGSTAMYRNFAQARLVTIQSILFPTGDCGDAFGLDPVLVAPALTFDLSTLGLVPPFTLAQ
jgi:hypothetical protein